MIYLYFVPFLVIGALVFERVTDPSRTRRRAMKREYGTVIRPPSWLDRFSGR
jgi:hypothetical protein